MRTELAKEADAEVIMNKLVSMHNECGFSSINQPKVFHQILDAIKDKECYVLLNDDQGVIGTVAVENYTPWWSDDKRMQDRWLYVDPDYRSIKSFKMLMQQAVEHAKYYKIPLYIMLNVEGAARKRDLFNTCMIEAMKCFEVSYVGGGFRADK